MSDIFAVMTAQSNPAGPFAMPTEFDFGNQVGPGQQILAYAVGLGGFILNYETNSLLDAENAGRLAVSLVPNLIGNVVRVDSNLVLTDYDGDSAQAPAGSSTHPASQAQITVLALIGKSANPNIILGNIFGLDGSAAPVVTVGSNSSANTATFLSGFSIATLSATSIGELNLLPSVSVQDPSATVTGTASVGVTSATTAIDVMLVSVPELPEGQSWNIAILPANITWGGVDGDSGMTGNFSVDFSEQAGNQSICNAAVLLQNLQIQYGAVADFQLIAAMPSPLKVDETTVTGTFNLNIFDPDFLANQYIDPKNSSVDLLVVAQFGDEEAIA